MIKRLRQNIKINKINSLFQKQLFSNVVEDAENLFSSSVEIYGPMNIEIALLSEKIAHSYMNLNENKKSEKYFVKAIEIYNEFISKEYNYKPQVAYLLSILGHNYFLLQDYDNSKKSCVESIRIWNELGSVYDEYCINPLTQLGILYNVLQDYTEEDICFEKAFIIAESLSKKGNNIDIAPLVNNLSVSKYKLSKFEESLKFCDIALDLYQKKSSEINNNIADVYTNMGFTYLALGDYSQSRIYFEKALDITQELYETETEINARNINNLGLVYFRISDTSKAMDLFQKSLEIRKKILSENHPDLIQSLNNIGSINSLLGNYTIGLKYFEDALSRNNKVFGEMSLGSQLLLSNISGINLKSGNYEKAYSIQQEVIKNINNLSHSNLLELSDCYILLGEIQLKQKQYKQSRECFKKSEKILQYNSINHHPKYCEIINNVLKIDHSQKITSDSETLLSKAFEINSQYFDRDNLLLASTYYQEGEYYNYTNKYIEAENSYNKSIEIVSKLLGEKHPIVADYIEGLAALYKNKNYFDQSDSLMKKVSNIRSIDR